MKKSELEKLKKFKKELIETSEGSKVGNKNAQVSKKKEYKTRIDSRDINNVWKKYIYNNNANFHLRFNKFLKYRDDSRNNKVVLDKTLKHRKIGYYKEIFYYISEKFESISKCLNSIGYKKIDKDFTRNLNDRMIIGLGEKSVREISIKLDHIYGIPYIPASTLKGAYRNYMEKEYELDYKGDKKIYREIINELFGTEDNEGQLIFVDTYPEEEFEIEKDVMTPHYSKYYTDGKPPTDDQDVKPIFFITLKEAQFKFRLFIKNEVSDNKKDLVKKSFNEFLDKEALGAKKAVGYGYFKIERSNDDGR